MKTLRHSVIGRFCGLSALALMMGSSPLTAAEQSATDVPNAALARYVAKPDNSYRWVKRSTGKVLSVEYAELRLTSQTWRNIDWKHQLFILRPSSVTKETRHGMLFIAGGRWKPELDDEQHVSPLPKEAAIFAAIAERLKTPVAVLLHVPFQPMFDGKVEDQIIALTFEQFLRTGDAEWPLLLPMAKSAVRGMDAVQEFARQEWELKLESFTVTGASKRGWTTWLTAAVDRRVTALAPMVIDVLNMQQHMQLQKKAWGDFSNQIHDYTERGLQHHLATDAGKSLRDIVDPYSYRAVLRQPKLMLIGTNDDYWPVDALNLYWHDLLGPKYVLYVPNNRHGLKDYGRVLATLNALHQHAANGFRLPKLTWETAKNGTATTLAVDSDVPPVRVDLWSATSATRDFRQSEWSSARMRPDGRRYLADYPHPERGSAAFFGEAVFEHEGLPYYLSTTMTVLEADKE